MVVAHPASMPGISSDESLGEWALDSSSQVIIGGDRSLFNRSQMHEHVLSYTNGDRETTSVRGDVKKLVVNGSTSSVCSRKSTLLLERGWT